MLRLQLLFPLVLLFAGCAAPGQDGGGSSGGAQGPAKTLTVATDAEIEGFGEMFAGGKSGPRLVPVAAGAGAGVATGGAGAASLGAMPMVLRSRSMIVPITLS